MGADIFLQSIWKPFEEKLSQTVPPESNPNSRAELEALMTKHYDAMRASGGYFRNGYNAGDVMWAMGMSWPDVGAMLDDQGYLPTVRAEELIAKIETRPLTRERVGAHVYKNMTGGVEEHPATGGMIQKAEEAMAAAAGVDVRETLPPDFDEMFGFLNKRRNELLAILRKSVELDEPLYCEV